MKQLQVGIDHGVLMAVDSRFILRDAVRQYDQKYEEGLEVAEPLNSRFPHNPIFMLLIGNLYLELGRNARAAEYFHAAQQATMRDGVCEKRHREIADSSSPWFTKPARDPQRSAISAQKSPSFR